MKLHVIIVGKAPDLKRNLRAQSHTDVRYIQLGEHYLRNPFEQGGGDRVAQEGFRYSSLTVAGFSDRYPVEHLLFADALLFESDRLLADYARDYVAGNAYSRGLLTFGETLFVGNESLVKVRSAFMRLICRT